jgi:hypothetical protein
LGSMKTVYGARIRIYGLTFYLLLDNLYGGVLIPDTDCILTPTNITYEAGLRKHIIALTWSEINPASVRGVTVSRPYK